VDSVFSPSVSATCRAGVMNIKVETNNNFLGAVHARDYRRPACTNYGQGTSSTSLEINLLADQNTDKYCGVFINKDNNERSVAIAVRIHKTLELADDKYYMITCGRASIVSARPHSRNSRSSKLRDPSTTSDSNSGYSGKRLVAK